MTRTACALALLAVACGAAPPPAAPAPKPETATEPEPVTPDPGPARPRARIIDVTLSNESAMFKRVKIVFENPTPTACKFTSYTLVWPGGRKTIEDKAFEVPGGGNRQRSLKVHPNDGDLDRLEVKGAEIEVTAGCSSGE